MRYFKFASPYGKIPDSDDWCGIQGSPTMKFEEYVFVRKPIPNFEKIWEIFTTTKNEKERLGCSSLFYFKYYNELNGKIRSILKEKNQFEINKIMLKLFITDYLNDWLVFIKRSDDLLYPQNGVFKDIAQELQPLFPEYIKDE